MRADGRRCRLGPVTAEVFPGPIPSDVARSEGDTSINGAVPPGEARSFASRAIHPPESATDYAGAVAMPIFLTSTFQRSVHLEERWDYSRVANPTRSALEACLADLDGGVDAVATSSGMGAISLAAMAICEAGSHVVLSDNVYGGTWDLFSGLLSRWNVDVSLVDLSDPDAVAGAIRPNTAMVYGETPSNPLQKIIDLRAVADVAHRGGALLVVDSTFASPVLQRPIEFGADVVIQSTTKYLGGHSDVIGGAAIAADPEMAVRLRDTARVLGSIESPFDAWQVLRGVKTLSVRMRQICENAQRVAEYLEAHPRVRRTFYPGLPSHPGHDVAAAQMSGFGGIVSVELDCDANEAAEICTRFELFTLAVSLGGVESLVEHPHFMTHCTTGPDAAIPASLLRLSIGLECADELIEDLVKALG